MRVVVAPDKFKGSLSAAEVADAVAAGLLRVHPDLDIARVPVADGGEGTLDAAEAAGFRRIPAVVAGPTGEPIETSFAVRNRTAVVEMAVASGLAVLPGGDFAPLTATSLGTGQLVRGALDHGCDEIVLGVGGSACTDGGAGLLVGLGARLLDAAGKELALGGAALCGLARVDLEALDARLAGVRVVLASDVDNPLLGPHGAAAVYGPQKGASPADVAALEAGHTRWVDVLSESLGERALDAAAQPGAGAAGGVGYAAVVGLGAVRRPGIDVVLELVGFADHLTGADLVVTGEGSLDEQTLHGKAPAGVAEAARSVGIPVVAVAGRSLLPETALAGAGIRAAYVLTDIEPDPARSMLEAGPLLERRGEQLAHDWLAPQALSVSSPRTTNGKGSS